MKFYDDPPVDVAEIPDGMVRIVLTRSNGNYMYEFSPYIGDIGDESANNAYMTLKCPFTDDSVRREILRLYDDSKTIYSKYIIIGRQINESEKTMWMNAGQ